MDWFDENKTPKDKFFEIVFNANRNITIEELEKVFQRLAALEIAIEECYKEEAENKINEIIYTRNKDIEQVENDLYIDTMANILTKNE